MKKEKYFLIVQAKIRFWEDSVVNGVEDTNGTLIPHRYGDNWNIIIDIDTGKIHDWPIGTTADIHYKVCDEGVYTVINKKGKIIAIRKNDYVPDHILSIVHMGYGDYLIFTVQPNGVIKNWKKFDPAELNK